MALTDIKIKQARPGEKIFKISDEKGLYLEVHPSGAKYWRHKYRFAGREKRIGYGVYPEVSLAEARIARDEARRLLRENIDPSQLRKTTKAKAKFEADNTFSALAAEWYEKQRPTWALSTAAKREAFVIPPKTRNGY